MRMALQRQATVEDKAQRTWNTDLDQQDLTPNHRPNAGRPRIMSATNRFTTMPGQPQFRNLIEKPDLQGEQTRKTSLTVQKHKQDVYRKLRQSMPDSHEETEEPTYYADFRPSEITIIPSSKLSSHQIYAMEPILPDSLAIYVHENSPAPKEEIDASMGTTLVTQKVQYNSAEAIFDVKTCENED